MNELTKPTELLPVVELLLLNEYNGKEAGYTLTPYQLEEYGYDYRERIKKLMVTGYLKFAEPEESLEFLKIPELKDILRANKQRLSGTKSELVARISATIEPEKYAGQIRQFYVATERGRRELEMRSVYIENQRQPYRFLNSEIAAVEAELLARGGYSSDKVFEQLYLRDTVKHGKAGDFGLLRNSYYDMYHFFKRRGWLKMGLRVLLTVIYIDLSGMGNGNTVSEYDELDWALSTRAWSELDKLRTALNLSDEQLKTEFDDAARLCVAELPFSYFSVGAMKEILIARLYGQMDLFDRYRNRRREPQENNPNYNYYDYSRNDDGEEFEDFY